MTNSARCSARSAVLTALLVLSISAVLGTGCSGDDDDDTAFEWTVLHQDLDGAILSIWGTGPDNIYAVGGTLQGGAGEGMILWYDGTTWWDMPVDVPTLWWVHGFARDDVWAVGERGTILHFDGTTWTTVNDGEDYTLFGAWGASPTDIWAVGGKVNSPDDGMLRHYDGMTWTDVPGVGEGGELLFKAWGPAADDAYIISNRGGLIHWDGTAWTRLESGTTERLLTVRGRGADDIYIVGGVARSVVLHRDASGWSSVESGIEYGLMGVWTAPDEPAIAVGFSGVIAVDDGKGWVTQEFMAPRELHAAWGDGNGLYLAGGGDLFSPGVSRGLMISSGEINGGPIQTWSPQ